MDTNINQTNSLHDQQALAFSFLAYLGEKSPFLDSRYEIAWNVYELIKNNIQNVPQLAILGTANVPEADWKIVWGPSFQFFGWDQQNMMYVVQQISHPSNYMVVIRGTNKYSVPNWIVNDLEVKNKVDWLGPYQQQSSNYGMISEGTNKAIVALLAAAPPLPENSHQTRLPGTGLTIEQFLKTISSQGDINITFCGHSLAGCLSPVMALYFAQSQGSNGSWDSGKNASIQVTSFAGPTPGDANFASYLANVIPTTTFTRYHDTNDIVPLAWNLTTFQQISTLYPDNGQNAVKPPNGAEMDLIFKLLQDILNKEYTQIGSSAPFTFPINTSQGGANGNTYLDQVGYQHHYSYPNHLNVPSVLIILADNAGK